MCVIARRPPKAADEAILSTGTFSIDKNNRLVYWLNQPSAWRRINNSPDKVAVEGRWRLDANSELKFKVQQSPGSFTPDVSTLKGEIISAEAGALVFELKTYDSSGLSHIQIVKLAGVWAVDKFNRLVFKIERKGSPDTLVFDGAWSLNRNQELEFTCHKTDLKRKDRSSYKLTFSGYWQISSKDRLAYILSQNSESRFDFKVQLESPNIYPKEGVIKYRLGAGLKKPKQNAPQVISLYGVWKVSRALGLVFETKCAKGALCAMEFGAEVNFKKNNEVVFTIKNSKGEKLGLNVIFTHRFLKHLDAKAFLRLKTAQDESGVDVGVKIPF